MRQRKMFRTPAPEHRLLKITYPSELISLNNVRFELEQISGSQLVTSKSELAPELGGSPISKILN